MAQLPVQRKNVPFTPYVDKTLTDIAGLYVPECLTTIEIDPVSGRANRVYSLGWGERNMWPDYNPAHLSKPKAYGKTPGDGW